MNGDHCTDFADLLLLLSDWGGTGCGSSLVDADINCNDSVEFNDLLLLLADWSCGSRDIGDAPSGIMDCINKYPNDAYRQTKCIEAMILANTP